jgi:hypothetical protein
LTSHRILSQNRRVNLESKRPLLSTWHYLVCLLLFFVAVPMVVAIRYKAHGIPSELDRIGADLSLFGYGIAVSLLLALFLGHRVFAKLNVEAHEAFGIAFFSFLLSVFSYLFTLHQSECIRKTKGFRFGKGVEKISQIQMVRRDGSAKRALFWSLVVGFLPTAFLFALEVLR